MSECTNLNHATMDISNCRECEIERLTATIERLRAALEEGVPILEQSAVEIERLTAELSVATATIEEQSNLLEEHRQQYADKCLESIANSNRRRHPKDEYPEGGV